MCLALCSLKCNKRVKRDARTSRALRGRYGLSMNTKLVASFLIFTPALAVARPPASDFANPIAGVILLGVILMCVGHWLKGAAENPFGAFRVVLACIVALFIGIGIPMSLIKFNFDPGAWVIPIWLGAWVVAYKVGVLIAGVSDDQKQP